MQEFKPFIERLHRMRAEFSDRLDRIRHHRHHVDGPVSADFKEQVVERENDEVLERLEAATAADLRQMDHALDRVQNGLYPLCEVCGDRVELERLRVMPFATACRVCVARQDTEKLLKGKSHKAAA